jgi:ATP-dependent metalloprotease
VAGEAGVPFFYMSGSEFEEVFVGVGAKRVRELFAAAKKRSPCIIFIDEIDAIGSHRNPKEQQAMKMTLNQLLVEMDGFQQNTGVIVLAATNFPESLDRALVRPGRFDTQVTVPLPDVKGREQILELYVKPVPLDDNVRLGTIARATNGFSGADLSNLVNVAALKASSDDKKAVSMTDLEYASDKIRMGAERKSAVISPENLKLTAYHEGGHALVALKTMGSMPIHKATIVPRGNTLGMVAYLPEKDQMNLSREQLLAHIDICMGGRVAEEIIFGKLGVTTGAGSDLQQATSTARNMVTKYGMSATLGPHYYSTEELEKLSSGTREAVENEVREMLTRAENNARRILSDNVDELHKLAKGLLEHETLTLSEIKELLANKKGELKSK